jgi:type VI secretion system secreted protein Hcp
MAVDMFIKIGDVEGEAQDDAHKKEIDVLSWSWGLAQSGNAQVGSGAGAGKVSIQDLSFTKYVDSASPYLMLACCNGKHYDEALLTIRKAGEDPLEYLTIKLTEVLVSSVSTGGSGGQDRLTENVSLNFSKVDVKYTPQNDDGSKASPIPMAWDIAANKKA